MIRQMTANTENLKARDAIKRKRVGNARNRIHQTHCRATLIRPSKLIIKSKDSIRRRAIVNRNLSNYAQSYKKSC